MVPAAVRGHTLIELVAALCVAGVLAAVVVPQVAAQHGRAATAAAATHFALVLRDAQARSRAVGEPVRVVVQADGRRYAVEQPSASGWRAVTQGDFGAAVCRTNYPDGVVEFSGLGWPHSATGSARAGTFTFGCAWCSRAVVVQMGGAVRCR